MKRIVAICLFIALTPFALQAQDAAPEPQAEPPQPTALGGDLSIAAIVNETIITSLDLEERMRLAAALTGQRVTSKAQVQQLRARVLQLLVNEALKMQAAERYSIMVDNAELDQAVNRIEQSRGKAPGSLEAFLNANQLSPKAFRDQVRADVSWSKLLAKVVRRDVRITDEEVRMGQERASMTPQGNELNLASILFPLPQLLPQEEVLAKAGEIRTRLQNGEEQLDVLEDYREQMKIEMAPRSWVEARLLDPAIAEALSGMQDGDLSNPLLTPAGVQVIRLYERRDGAKLARGDAEVALKQIILKLSDNSSNYEIEVMMDVARLVAKDPGSCVEQGIAGVQNFEGTDVVVNYIRTTLSNMSPEIRPMVEPLNVTQITEPFAAPDGIHLLMLCERIAMPAAMPDKEEVRQALFTQKLELEAEKYLRNLRREAFIDIRS